MNDIYEDNNASGNRVNADRNEMIALLQGAKGAQFVNIRTNSSRLSTTKIKSGVAPEFTYKAIDLDLKVGDKVVVQWRERFGIGEVVKVFSDVPTSSEYDYSHELKHVVQVIDTKRSLQLEELDRQMLRKITASEASDRLERLTRQLGIDMDQITLALPDVDGSSGDSQ